MTHLSSGLIVIAAYLVLLAVFGYLILTDPQPPAPDPEPRSLDAPLGLGVKLTGLVAAATLIGTSLVMWFDR